MKRHLIALSIAAGLSALSGAASATTVNFTSAEAPGVTCCGLMDSSAYSAYGLTVTGAYWYADGRDTFDGQGLSVFTAPTATIALSSTSASIDFQYWVIGGFRGTYEAFDSGMTSLGSFTVDATGGDVLGTHSFSGGVKYLTFSGDTGFTQVSSITFAVPEPETYALMMAGLGVLGAVARRRSASSK